MKPSFCTIAIATYGPRIHRVELPSPCDGVCYLITWQHPDGDVPASLRRADVQVWGMGRKGLSHARNAALLYTQTPVMLLADDDLVWDMDALVSAAHAFQAHGAAIGVADFFHGPEKKLTAHRAPDWEPKSALGSVSSWEIFLRPDWARDHDTAFDPSFGVGSGFFPAGEENLFLAHLVAQGASCVYLPYILGWHPDVSTGYRPTDVKGVVGKLRVAATLRPFPPSWIRRLRAAFAMPGLTVWERLVLCCTPTPAVPSSSLESLAALAHAERLW